MYFRRFGAERCIFLLFLIVFVMFSSQALCAPLNFPTIPTDNAVRSAKPWGELNIQRILLGNTASMFLDRGLRLQKPAWHFENYSAPQLLRFFGNCELARSVGGELLNTNRWTVQNGGCVVFPSDDLILKLTPLQRERIYAVLAQSETNYAQRWPFRIPFDEFNERFASASLPEKKLQLIRSLTYTNGHQLCFCDLATIENRMTTNEFRGVIEALYSVPTEWVRLHVTRDSNIDGLANYWGRGGRDKRIRPLLESLAEIPGGGDINISFLLPPFPRFHLYVYPHPESDVTESRTDCVFTSLNFFNETADTRFLDPNQCRQTFQTDYAPVHDQPTFGDLITLVNRNGETFHVAVYIAQDILFTKNGENYLQPWVLMHMEDLIAFYGAQEPVRTIIYRHKNS